MTEAVRPSTALYFPFTTPPTASWFVKVLLYWDAAAVLVPKYSQDSDDWDGSGYGHELHRAGLIKLIDPFDMTRSTPDFNEVFLSLLETRLLPRDEDKEWYQAYEGSSNKALFRELRKQGWAYHPSGPFYWLMERRAWQLYQSLIIGILSGVDSTIVPVTDRVAFLDDLAGQEKDSAAKLHALNYALIMRVLPIPSRPVPVSEIASFKRDHEDELVRLRNYLTAKVVDLAIIDDEFLRGVKTQAVMYEIRDELTGLREQMEKRAWPPVIFGGLAGMVASGAATTAALAAGGNALLTGLTVGSALVGFANSAYITAGQARAPRFDRRAPLAYAALTERL